MDDMNATTDDNRIEELMREQEMSREQAQAAIEAVQSGGDEPTICVECGSAANRDEGRAVAQYPDPVSGETRPLCSSCFVERAVGETLLSEQQAQILALDIAGWRSKAIQDAVGVSSGALSGQRSRARDKAAKAVEQIDEGQRTLFVMEALDDE